MNNTEQETIDWLEEYKKLSAPKRKPSLLQTMVIEEEQPVDTDWVKEYKRVTRRKGALAEILRNCVHH